MRARFEPVGKVCALGPARVFLEWAVTTEFLAVGDRHQVSEHPGRRGGPPRRRRTGWRRPQRRRPETTYFWANSVTIAAGTMAITAVALMRCHSTPSSWTNWAMVTVSSGVRLPVRIRANRNSFQVNSQQRMPSATIPGRACGSTIRTNAPQGLRPEGTRRQPARRRPSRGASWRDSSALCRRTHAGVLDSASSALPRPGLSLRGKGAGMAFGQASRPPSGLVAQQGGAAPHGGVRVHCQDLDARGRDRPGEGVALEPRADVALERLERLRDAAREQQPLRIDPVHDDGEPGAERLAPLVHDLAGAGVAPGGELEHL